MLIGRTLAHNPGLSLFGKLYISIFGVPISGLRNRVRRVLPFIKDGHNRILDAGCGTGVFSYEMARRLPESEVLGVDLNDEAIAVNNEIAKRAGIDNCRFERADILDLIYEDEFDLVLSIDNLEHIADDELACRNIWRALKPGGRLILHVPGLYRRWLFFGKRVNFDVPSHVRPGYLREEIVDKLIKTGFQILDSHYTYGYLETVTNNISYLVTGAEMKHEVLYAFLFPFLLAVSWFGQFSKPKWGAGVLVIAKRP